MLGADHHGYVPRMRAALAALGFDPDRFEAPIMQLVHIVEGGERAQMSKRSGEFVTLDELIDDIGVDAARFFMLQRSHDTPIDLDLELARTTSQENPVYYVQYAHARIASILRKAADEGVPAPRSEIVADAAGGAEAVAEPAERALSAACSSSPARSRRPRSGAPRTGSAPTRWRPRRLPRLLSRLPGGGAPEPGAEAARLGLCVATKRTIATTLGLLGVSAPERM